MSHEWLQVSLQVAIHDERPSGARIVLGDLSSCVAGTASSSSSGSPNH